MKCLRWLTVGAMAFGLVCCDEDDLPVDVEVPEVVEMVGGDEQTGEVGSVLPDSLVVRVLTSADRPASDVEVNWQGGGSFSPASVATDEDGIARTAWTLRNTPGEVNATATVAGLTPVEFSALVVTGPPANLVKLSGDDQTGKAGGVLWDSLAVRVRDAYGNSVADAQVTWSVTGGGGSVSPGTVYSSEAGIARVSWTLGPQIGENTVTASVEGADPVSFTATGTVGDAAIVTAVRGNDQTGTVAFPLGDSVVVQVTDAHGNPVAGVLVHWAAAPGDGSLSPVTASTNTVGEARALWTLGQTAGSQTSQASVSDLDPAGFTAVGVAGAPASLEKISGDEQTGQIGTELGDSLVVRVYDAFDNVKGGAVVEWTTEDWGGSFSPASTLSDSLGFARTAWSVGNVAGVNTATASVEGVSSKSFTATVQAGGLTFIHLVVGISHSCGLTTDGSAYCWGSGANGKLGTGLLTDETVPASVQGGRRFVRLAAGRDHTCGLTSAGTVFCWGAGAGGALGTGSTENEMEPAAVVGDLTFVDITAGNEHTCGLGGDGVSYCWGNPIFGGFGDDPPESALEPLPVSGELSFAQISAGAEHTCAVTGDGDAYCWGYGSYGRLGTGSTSNQLAPTAVSTTTRFSHVAAGDQHTCAISETGAGFCWGQAMLGRLGTGAPTSDKLTPASVSGGFTFAQATTGNAHSCAWTLVGKAYCWGAGAQGQLGTGSTTNQFGPADVYGGLQFVQVAAGGEHTCGLTGDGAAYCWGRGSSGQLGNGETDNRLRAVPVADPRLEY